MEKLDFRRLTEQERLGFRKQAIKLIKSGRKKGEVSEIIGVRSGSISLWWKDYQQGGIKGLESKKKGVKSEDKKLLSKRQEQEIQDLITDQLPEQLKLDFALWTRKAVKEFVEKKFGIIVAINTMGDYLRKWGLTPQNPKKKAYEQDDKKVQKWLEEEYPSIQKLAKGQDAEIYWGDECAVINQCHYGRSYAPKGKKPVKKSMAKRFSVNMISTITNQGKGCFLIYSENMNATKLIEFMEQLIKFSSKKVFLILDNLRVHHCKLVKEWQDKNKDRIRLLYLH